MRPIPRLAFSLLLGTALNAQQVIETFSFANGPVIPFAGAVTVDATMPFGIGAIAQDLRVVIQA